ncbi:hypothetical protein [Nocardia sp. XZ_19_385]|uniref:hypothetical protein n=1 Tax=Nocardia sp. XZ_19_385 TaxID=2769488 RepID=UPI0018908384|nr:hypothetical protein [Nocardia sp. XZ_19_385]
MNLKHIPVQQFSVRAAAIATTVAAALVGFAAPAAAGPTDPVVQFTPTLTRVPGNCAALISAETVPQPRSGEFGVRVKITQFGQGCKAYHLGVSWRNLDTGRTSGQVHPVDGTVVSGAPDGVITGFGMGPGAGKVEARIVTYSQYYPQPQELEHFSGRATFTLS